MSVLSTPSAVVVLPYAVNARRNPVKLPAKPMVPALYTSSGKVNVAPLVNGGIGSWARSEAVVVSSSMSKTMKVLAMSGRPLSSALPLKADRSPNAMCMLRPFNSATVPRTRPLNLIGYRMPSRSGAKRAMSANSNRAVSNSKRIRTFSLKSL